MKIAIVFIAIVLCVGCKQFNQRQEKLVTQLEEQKSLQVKDSNIFELTYLEVKNEQIFQILDTVIEFEKKCDYYDEDIFFVIRKEEHSPYPNSYRFGADLYLHASLELNKIEGFFFHKNHLVLVKTVDTSLYSRHMTMQFFSEELRTEFFPDDRGSSWIYSYENNHFTFKKLFTYCE